MDWFLYDNSLRHDRVKIIPYGIIPYFQRSSELLVKQHMQQVFLIARMTHTFSIFRHIKHIAHEVFLILN